MKSLLAILVFAVAAVAADQPIAPVTYVPSMGNDSPRAATNGDTMFVVWRVPASGLIEGACLRHDGTVLQAPSILIGTGANLNYFASPSVLWIGGHYLVLWTDTGGKSFARRFAGDGSSLDAVSRPTNVPIPRNVVSDGTNVMVISDSSTGIISQRIDADGQPMGSPVQSSASGAVEAAGASSNGVVILRITFGVYESLLLGWDGAIRLVTPIPGSWSYGSLAKGDDGFLLTGGFHNALRLSFNGTPIGPIVTIGDEAMRRLHAAWNGTSWCVVGSVLRLPDDYAIRVARITADGRIDASLSYPGFDGIGVNDLLWNGTTFVAIGGVFSGVRASLFDTVEASVLSARNVPVSLAAPEESDAVIASTADRSLAVWRVRIDGQTLALRGAFITDGLPSAPFEIAPEVEDEAPAVATDGTDFFVAWHYGATISARIVSAQQVLGPVQQLDAWSGRGAVGVTWSGRAWVMAYVDTMVHVAAFQRSGTLAVDPFVVPVYANPISSFVSLSCDDSDCLLVVRLIEADPHIGEVPPNKTGTWAARVSRDGTNAGPPVWIARNSATGWPLAMRVNGASVIISSEDGKSLSAVRLDAPGTTTRLVSRTVPLHAVSVDRNGLYWYETQADGSTLLHWSSVSAQQLPVITSTIDLGGAMPAPVAASSTSTQSHVLFSDGATDPDLLAARLFIRTFASPDPLPPPSPARRRTAK